MSSAQPTSLQFTLSSVQRPSSQFSVTVTGPASAAVVLDTSSDLSTWTPGYATFTLNGRDPSRTRTHRLRLRSGSIAQVSAVPGNSRATSLLRGPDDAGRRVDALLSAGRGG